MKTNPQIGNKFLIVTHRLSFSDHWKVSVKYPLAPEDYILKGKDGCKALDSCKALRLSTWWIKSFLLELLPQNKLKLFCIINPCSFEQLGGGVKKTPYFLWFSIQWVKKSNTEGRVKRKTIHHEKSNLRSSQTCRIIILTCNCCTSVQSL